MSGTATITEGSLLRKRRDKQVVQDVEVKNVQQQAVSMWPAGQIMLALDAIFEVVNPGAADEYLRVKLPIGCDYEVQAYTDNGQLPGNIWESMPVASATVLGGVKVGSGLSISNGVLSASGTSYTFQHSIVNNAGTVNLVGDVAAPGNSKMYGTNGAGTRGWYDVPSSMVYPGAGIALSTGSAWGASITNNSANWNTAYSHTSLTNNPHVVTAAQVGLGNVTNESKATMFSSPTFTGTVTIGNNGILCVGNSNEIWYDGNQASDAGTLYINYRGYLAGQTYYRDTVICNGKGAVIVNVDGSSSYVGIGTTPETKFHIVQSANAPGFFSASTANTGYAGFGSYSAYYGAAFGVNTTSANYYAFLINSGVTLTTGGWTGGTTQFVVWADGATVRGTVGSSALANARYFHSQTFMSATSGDKCLYLFNNGYTIKLDAYDYGTNTALGFTLGGNGGNVTVANNLNANGEVTAYYSSDARLKQNIQSFSALDKIDRVNNYAYQWNEKAKELNNQKDDRVNYGWLAQEIEPFMPELVHSIYGQYKSVDYVQGVPIAFQGIKELHAKLKQQDLIIEQLKKELNELKNARSNS